MRALAMLGVAFACVYGCGGDSAPSAGSSADGGGGAGGRGDDVHGGEPDAGQPPVAFAGAGGVGASDEVGGAGGAVTAGTAGEVGAAGSAPVAVEVGIVPEATSFLDYGKLRIVFEEGVEASTLRLTLTPARPVELVATTFSQVDATTVDATLAYYHLPLDYRLYVTGNLADARPFEASIVLSGNNGARVAFLSKQSGNGAFTSWANVPPAATPAAMADGVCQREATAAGLSGTFKAFFSLYGSFDAGCRAFGLDGLLADECGQTELPVDDTPILGMNGLPVAAGATGLVADHWKTPISYYADGTVATPDYLWTGTIAGAKGYADDDCGGWTKTTGLGIASLYAAKRLIDYDFGRSCDVDASLLCLQTNGTFFGPSKLHEVGGRRAFVSRGKLFGTMSFAGKSGVAAADALCQSEAATANFSNADKFRAYIGTAETDALCYVLGKTGKVADHCGLAALPNTDPWRRPDDYPIGTAAELAANTLRSPLALAADSTLMTNERPRTGTELSGATSWNCGDWSSAGFYSLSGSPGYITGDWTSHWTTDCDGEETSVYCFEN